MAERLDVTAINLDTIFFALQNLRKYATIPSVIYEMKYMKYSINSKVLGGVSFFFPKWKAEFAETVRNWYSMYTCI